jgi:hypothetical protein
MLDIETVTGRRLELRREPLPASFHVSLTPLSPPCPQVTGVAGNVEAEFWGYAGRSPDNPANEPFIKWMTAVSNTSDADVPKLFSTSYVAQFRAILAQFCAIL